MLLLLLPINILSSGSSQFRSDDANDNICDYHLCNERQLVMLSCDGCYGNFCTRLVCVIPLYAFPFLNKQNYFNRMFPMFNKYVIPDNFGYFPIYIYYSVIFIIDFISSVWIHLKWSALNLPEQCSPTYKMRNINKSYDLKDCVMHKMTEMYN